MESQELLVCKLGYSIGNTAGIVLISCVGEQCASGILIQYGRRVAVASLHLVVDNSLPLKPAVGILLKPYPLLHERLLAEQREEHGITVHLHQVEIVLLHHCGGRIHSTIRVCHCIQECVDASLQKLEEGILYRKMLGAGQHRMLHDVCSAAVVRRRSLEYKGKQVLRVIVLYMEDLASCPFMSIEIAG